MGSLCIRCDTCGKTVGSEKYSEFGIPSISGGNSFARLLRQDGWTGDLNRESNNDKCPECSAKNKLHDAATCGKIATGEI